MPPTELPPELWLQVFRWLIDPEALGPLMEDYVPFESSWSIIQGTVHRSRARRTIYNVSHGWRALIRQALYAEIALTNHGAHVLRQALRDKEVFDEHDRRTHASLVRALILPYPLTQTTAYENSPEQSSTEIVRLCDNLRILIRPPAVLSNIHSYQFEFNASDLPSLSSLRRLEWTYHEGASRTGGINALHEVLFQAPNLRYLSIGGTVSFARHELLELNQLTTIRLVGVITPLQLRQICSWSLPALTHVVLAGKSNVFFAPLWTQFGGRIGTLELGSRMSYFISRSYLEKALEGCLNLGTLNYHVYFAMIPQNEDVEVFDSSGTRPIPPRERAHTVGLNFQANEAVKGDGLEFQVAEQHFCWITDKRYFPALQTIRIYGGWGKVREDERFQELFDSASGQGYEIEWA